jgi:hypothetical protein
MDKSDNIIKIYESIVSVSKETKIPRTSISNCCFLNIENNYHTAYDFKWKFAAEGIFL